MDRNTYIVVIAILLFSASGVNGQTQKRQALQTPAPSSSTLNQSYPVIRAGAQATADALMRGDFNTVADNTYHRVVKLMGGRANTVLGIEAEMRKIERKGYSVTSVNVGEPNKVQIIGKQIFSIVPIMMTMKIPIGTLVAESFMIAVSEDSSKTWTLIDGTIAADRQALRLILPFAAGKLLLPPRKKPVIYQSERS